MRLTTHLRNPGHGLQHFKLGTLAGVLCGVALFASTCPVFAQSDDFNDGNDLGWSRYDPIGSHPQLPDIASYSVINGAYRIWTTPSPLAEVVGPARAGSIRTDVTYTDFYVTVDLVDWDETLQQSVGILGRVTDIGLGTTDGYVLTYNFLGQDIDITQFTNEDPAAPNGRNLPLSGPDELIMEKGKSYRMVFWGRRTELGARIFELPNLTTPLLDVTTTDTTFASGYCGLLVYDNSDAANMATDATFDNYSALTEEPPVIEMVDLGFGLLNVQWAGRAGSFKLEFTEELPATTWTRVDELFISYFPDVDRYIYQFDGSIGQQFFRLAKP